MDTYMNGCKHFKELCSCKQNYLSQHNIGELSEHYLALVLYALATKNTEVKGDSVALTCDTSINNSQWRIKLRCDGMLYVDDVFNRSVVNYNYMCMPVILSLLQTWERNNIVPITLGKIRPHLVNMLARSQMDDVRVLLSTYVNVTK